MSMPIFYEYTAPELLKPFQRLEIPGDYFLAAKV